MKSDEEVMVPIANKERPMGVKISLADITIKYREHELPDQCPKCKEDLREDGAVISVEWSEGRINSTLMVANGGLTITTEPTSNASWEYEDDFYPVALLCSQCRHELASGIIKSEMS